MDESFPIELRRMGLPPGLKFAVQSPASPIFLSFDLIVDECLRRTPFLPAVHVLPSKP